MEYHLVCPHCGGHLKVGDHVIFSIRNEKKQKGLLLLHAEIGNYSSLKHPSLSFEKGESLEFFCPLCNVSLASDLDVNLVHLRMLTGPEKEEEVYFSRVSGEHSTFLVSGDEVKISGEHAGRYTFFKFPSKFKHFIKK